MRLPAAHRKVVAASMKIRRLVQSDWPKVSSIYQEGIETGYATFETQVPTWEAWDKSHMSACRFVAESEGVVAGWSALSPVSSRCVYAGVAEVSVYVAKTMRGKGIGHHLLKALIEGSEAIGIWTLTAGIFPQNAASLKLHQDMGFRIVGVRERIGKLHGIWYDNCLLERRSNKIGIA